VTVAGGLAAECSGYKLSVSVAAKYHCRPDGEHSADDGKHSFQSELLAPAQKKTVSD